MENHVTQTECYKTKISMTQHINSVKEELKEDISDVKLEIAELPAKIIKELRGEFAPKWVGDVVKFILAGFGIAVIGVIANLILK